MANFVLYRYFITTKKNWSPGNVFKHQKFQKKKKKVTAQWQREVLVQEQQQYSKKIECSGSGRVRRKAMDRVDYLMRVLWNWHILTTSLELKCITLVFLVYRFLPTAPSIKILFHNYISRFLHPTRFQKPWKIQRKPSSYVYAVDTLIETIQLGSNHGMPRKGKK